MKKFVIILLSITWGVSLFSQVRYYNWDEERINVYAPRPVSNGDMVYAYGALFYTVLQDNRTYLCKLYENGNFEFIDPNNVYPLQNTRFCSGINSLFFVNRNNILQRYNLQTNTLTNVAETIFARGDGLTFGAGTNEIYFTRTNGQICYSQWNGSWATTVITQQDICPPKNNSRFIYHGWKLIYTDTLSKLRMLCYVQDSSRWMSWVMNDYAPESRGDGLCQGEIDEVFYTEKNDNYDYKNGRIVHLKWNGSIYVINIINYADPALQGTNFTYGDGTLFYVNRSGIINILKWQPNNCIWANEHLNTIIINSGTNAIAYGSQAMYVALNETRIIYKLFPTIDNNYQFIYLKGRQFFKGDTPFYPNVINYGTNIYHKKDQHHNDSWQVYLGPSAGRVPYDLADDLCNKRFSDSLLRSDLMMIDSLGFNTIRILPMVMPAHKAPGTYLEIRGINLSTCDTVTTQVYPDIFGINEPLFNAFQEFLEIVDSLGLKVIFTTGGMDTYLSYYPVYYGYLEDLASRFANNTTILAYDYYNEPANTFTWGKSPLNTVPSFISMSKEIICSLSRNCYESIREHDPNHLITIGIHDYRDVGFWDPGTISSDFLSYHNYGGGTANKVQFNNIVRNIKNSLYWIKNTSALKKPWIIGEIGFAGTNDTILTCSKDPVSIICPGFVVTPTTTTYERLQRDFCDTTYKDVRACGGSGYSWWDYQDSRESAGRDCAGAHWGIFTNCHEPKEIIYPPENNIFQNDWGSMPCGNFVNPDMMSVFYYNHFPEWNSAITGFVVDINSQEPISNAYVEGMYFDNDSILHFGNKTFTDSIGYFRLALNPGIDTPPNFLIISAMGKEREHVFDPPVQHDDIYTVHNLSCKPYGEPGEFGLPDNDNFKSEINKINKSSLYPKTKIYPNPTTGMVSIEFYLTQSTIVKTEVQNLMGNTIRSSEFGTLTAGNYNRKLDLSDLPNGIYIIKFNGNNNIEMFKIIINK